MANILQSSFAKPMRDVAMSIARRSSDAEQRLAQLLSTLGKDKDSVAVGCYVFAAALEEVLGRAHAVSPRTREAVVRDLVFLARLDDHYHDEEKRIIGAIAARLRIPAEQLSRIEQQATLPPVLAGKPSWFRELWFLGSK